MVFRLMITSPYGKKQAAPQKLPKPMGRNRVKLTVKSTPLHHTYKFRFTASKLLEEKKNSLQNIQIAAFIHMC